MIKETVLEVGEGKQDYPKLHQHVSPVLRQFAMERRDVKLTHTIDANGVSTMTIVAQPKTVEPTLEDLADNKATSVRTDESGDDGNPASRRRAKSGDKTE